MRKRTNQSLACNQGCLSFTWENRLLCLPLPFVELESKDSSKNGISAYDLYKYCRNVNETLRWDL